LGRTPGFSQKPKPAFSYNTEMSNMFNKDKSFRISKRSILIAVLINLFFGGITSAELRDIQIEKRIIKYISSDEFSKSKADQQCHDQNNYRIYLIDNFEQYFNIIPGVRTSHG